MTNDRLHDQNRADAEVVAALELRNRPPLSMQVLLALRDWGGSQGISGRAVAEHVEATPTTTIKCLHEHSLRGLAQRFGVHLVTIHSIVTGRTWQ